MLALAHHVDQLIEEGVIRDYAEAATHLRISRARVSQVLDLVLLSPEIQAQLLLAGLEVHERRLRVAVRALDWGSQAAAMGLPAP